MADSGCELTPFQRKKILRVFHILYDVNQDGVISHSDFTAAIDKVCKILDWNAEEKAGKKEKAEKTLMDIWEQLRLRADSNADEKVSTDEWVKMWSESINDYKKDQSFPEWQKKFMDFMFEVNDKSGDSKIDLDEYKTFCTAHDVSEEECESAFQIISGGNKYINKDEFEKLWVDFFVTETKEAAKGNYLFGDPDKYPGEN